MDVNTIRQKYLEFFVQKAGHRQIPAAPLVPPDDPTTLFTSSGMQQLVPYLKGATHPMGVRLVDSQPSFRAEDIEEIGDNRHTTMFEMLGNWSLGDYFKSKQLEWFFTFLTHEDYLNLDPTKLYVTVFAGDDTANAPKDSESVGYWENLFLKVSKNFAEIGITKVTVNAHPEQGLNPSDRIFYYPAKKNWWSRAGVPENMPVGEIGGPDSEVFYDFGADLKLHENSAWANEPCHPNCDCGRFLEIGNSVFMQYEKQADGSFKPLPKQNVDFGGGLERLAAASQNTPDVFQIDMFKPVIDLIAQSSQKPYEGQYQSAMRVIADHLRAATMMIAQGLKPGNKLQGYILRRLLRRAAVKGRRLGADLQTVFSASVPAIIASYSQAGFINSGVQDQVINTISEELNKFSQVLSKGLKEIDRADQTKIDEQFAFDLYQSYGFPFEITSDLLKEKGVKLDQQKFDQIFNRHKQESRTASAGMFKGGLADHSETVTKLHTATHLLQKSLQTVLGDFVRQEGSNITAERLRFDYHSPVAPTKEQLDAVKALINQKIAEDLPVTKTIEAKDEAIGSGAMAFFKENYPEKVSVYTIGRDPKTDWFSKELCGGPHVSSTGEIGAVTIKKDESIGANVRRIYVVLEAQETPAHGNQKHPRQN